MDMKTINIEGIEIEYEDAKSADESCKKRMMAYYFKSIREQSGMNRKDFADWLEIPYRTMQEWELGRRTMPDYVLKLIAYKVKNEMLNQKVSNKDEK